MNTGMSELKANPGYRHIMVAQLPYIVGISQIVLFIIFYTHFNLKGDV